MVARGVAALLHGDRGDARQRLAGLVREQREISDHEDLGMAGHGQVGLDADPAGAVERGAERTRRAAEPATPAAQRTVAGVEAASAPSDDAVLRPRRSPASRSGLRRREPLESSAGRSARTSGRIGGRMRGPGLDQEDARLARIDASESRSTRTCRAISAIAPASSTPVGPPPTIDEGQERLPPLGVGSRARPSRTRGESGGGSRARPPGSSGPERRGLPRRRGRSRRDARRTPGQDSRTARSAVAQHHERARSRSIADRHRRAATSAFAWRRRMERMG